MKNRLCILLVLLLAAYANAQTIFLAKGSWARNPELVKDFARKKISSGVTWGLLVCKDKELTWKANTVQQFDQTGFDTIPNPDTDPVLAKYILQQAINLRNKRKIVAWFCGKRASWKGSITKTGFDGRVMVLPVIPAWVCGCSRETIGEKEAIVTPPSGTCTTIHDHFSLDTILPEIAPCLFKSFTTNPAFAIDKKTLWAVSISSEAECFPCNAYFLKFSLNTFKCDTIPIRTRGKTIPLTKDILSSQPLLSVKDSTILLAFSSHIIRLSVHNNIVSVNEIMDLSFIPAEMKLISPESFCVFTTYSVDSSGLQTIPPELVHLNLNTGKIEKQELPFLVPEILFLNPTHYVSVAANRIFTSDAFTYQITVFDSALQRIDSFSRSFDWHTIPSKTLHAYNDERDSLKRSGRKTLSCSTVDFSLSQDYFYHWDKICGIYASNDSTLIVVYQKHSDCNSAVISTYYKGSDQYIPFFYDIWKRNSNDHKFTLVNGDLQEYFPPKETLSNKPNFPFNTLNSLPMMIFHDSTVAVWNLNPKPFGLSYSRLNNKFIATTIKLSQESNPSLKPSLYIYRIR